MAALKDVQLCHELGFYMLILEDDALKVVQALRNKGKNWRRCGLLISHLTCNSKIYGKC